MRDLLSLESLRQRDTHYSKGHCLTWGRMSGIVSTSAIQNKVRGSARGMGVDWSTIAEKAFEPRKPGDSEAEGKNKRKKDNAGGGITRSFNAKKVFRSWDADSDGSLTVLEICWGLRSGKNMPPPLMAARIVKHLETLTSEDKNPDWHFMEAEEFSRLLYTAVPEETSMETFVSKYSDPQFLESILPEHSLESMPEEKKKGKKKSRKKKQVKKNPEEKQVKSRINKIFESWDTDGDGTLSVQEIKDALGKDNGDQLKPNELAAVQKYIAALESNGNVIDWLYLDPEEFKEIVWSQ